MTPAGGSRGIGETYPRLSPVDSGGATGDRNPRSSYPPERSTHECPAQTHKSIDVTGDPGDRTAFLTTRDVREEKTHGRNTPCDPMCPHIDQEFFYAHPVEGQNHHPYHPDHPCDRCICGPDQRNHTGSGSDLSPVSVETIPGEPEPAGPLAAQFLDRLAAQDADRADRRRAALRRLGRANTTNPLVRHKP